MTGTVLTHATDPPGRPVLVAAMATEARADLRRSVRCRRRRGRPTGPPGPLVGRPAPADRR